MPMESLKLSPIADLSELADGRELAALNIGPDQSVCLLFAHYEPPRPLTPSDIAEGTVGWIPRAESYRAVAIRNGTLIRDTVIHNERANAHYVQPFENGWLLVGSRTEPDPNGELYPNAFHYSHEGTMLAEFTLGDGINDVQTTLNGTIWVSYFDEGVYSYFGNIPPFGGSGLLACDSTGKKVFEYKPPVGLDTICDCYALNVMSEDEVWLCYYVDFPLVQLREGQVVRYWQAPVQGSKAIAIDAGYCLFGGGYNKAAVYTVAALEVALEPRIVNRFILLNEREKPLTPEWTAARGEAIFMAEGTRLYRLDVATSLRGV